MITITWIAKVENTTTGQLFYFDQEQALLGGWNLGSTFKATETEFPGMDGALVDDHYLRKKSNQISLTIKLTCETAEEARTVTEQLVSILASRAKIWLFDDRYTYVLPKSTNGAYVEQDTRYVDITFNLTSPIPYFIKDIEEEMVITSANYPISIDMTNPHPAANVRLGDYDLVTGLLTNEKNNWFMKTGYISNTTAGEGFEFTCFTSFVLHLWHGTGEKKIKVFDNGKFLEERSIVDNIGVWKDTEPFELTRCEEHRIVVIISVPSLSIKTINIAPSNLNVLISNGSTDSKDVKIVVSPTDTSSVLSPLGKITDDVKHPFRTGNITFTDINTINPTQFTDEVWQPSYDILRFQDSIESIAATSSAGSYIGRWLEFNLKASGTPYYGMTPDEIKNNMKSILAEIWARGKGVSDLSEDGAKVFPFDDDLNSTDGSITPIAGAVATLRPDEGFYGGAVAVEEGTTNCIVDLDFENGDEYGLGTGLKTYRQDPKYGKVMKLTKTDGTTERFGKRMALSGMSGNFYTQYVYVRSLSATGRVALYTDAQSDVGLMSSSIYKNLSDLPYGEWVKLEKICNDQQLETLSGSGNLFVWIDIENGECEFGLPQVECLLYSTSHTIGTRANGNLKFQTNLDLTQSGWVHFKVNSEKVMEDHDNYYNGGMFNIGYSSGGTRQLDMWMRDAGFVYLINGIQLYTQNYTKNQWYDIDVVWENGNSQKLYIDGVLVYSDSRIFTEPGNGIVELGTFNNGSYINCCLFDEFFYETRVPTDAEVLDMHTNGRIKNGVEFYVLHNGDWESIGSHTNNSSTHYLGDMKGTYWLPSLITDDKLYILIKPKYPSDGINQSEAYIDYARLTTVHSLVKLAGNIVTNTTGNLLINGHGEYSADDGYNQISPLTQTLFSDSVKTVLPSQQVTLSFEAWRDDIAVASGLYPQILFLHYVDSAYIGFKGQISYSQFPLANTWKRVALTFNLKDDSDITLIQCLFYREPNNSHAGTVKIRNALLTPIAQTFQPQEKQTLGFLGDGQTLTKDDRLLIDPANDDININGLNLLPYVNDEYLVDGFSIKTGFNQFAINHTGSNLKMTINRKEYYHTP